MVCSNGRALSGISPVRCKAEEIVYHGIIKNLISRKHLSGKKRGESITDSLSAVKDHINKTRHAGSCTISASLLKALRKSTYWMQVKRLIL